jgi:L-cysteine:1D-myo-inositol 2-amino-2-deoxy-alpha-D-glucopyranoside ligase
MAFLDGQKMSKSLGNMVFIRDALDEHSADALRWYLLSFPYRDDFHYQNKGVVAAEGNVAKLRDALAAHGGAAPAAIDHSEVRAAFFAALDDDLQTPLALALLNGLSSDILAAAARDQDVRPAQVALREIAGVIGFWAAQENL